MKKKIMAALLVFVLIQSLLPVIFAAEPSSDNLTANRVGVTVNGDAVQWPDAIPFIDEHGRTMVPLRAVADAIGLDVSWNANTKEASFANGSKTIIFPIGSNTARTSGGAYVTMNTAAVAVNGRTYAPIRYLAEYFGYQVDWDANSRTVIITEVETPTQQPETPSVVPAPDIDGQVMSAECVGLLELINAKRTAAGLKALTINNDLAQGAKLRADDISKGYMEARGDGSNWDSIVKGLPDTATDLHETMAGGSDTASGIFDIMQTPDSIASMLNETYTQIGIGHVYNANGYGGYTDFWSVLYIAESSSPSGGVTGGDNLQSQRQGVLDLVNAVRAQNGAGALTLNEDLCSIAQLRADEIVQSFSHTRPNGSDCFTALKEANVSYGAAAENIAAGANTPADVMDMWMNSEGHRANILNPSLKAIGIGYVKVDSGYGHYWVQMFTG